MEIVIVVLVFIVGGSSGFVTYKVVAMSVTLDVTHRLVNGAFTAALQSQLTALSGQLTLMKELSAMRGTADSETQAHILDAQAKIADLKKEIAERVAQAKLK